MIPMSKAVTASIVVLLVFAALAAACQGSSEGTNGDEITHEDASLAGGHPPAYGAPVNIVSGEYKSPAGFPGARDRGLAAEQAEGAEPTFEGEIAGMELRRFNAGNWPNYCGGDNFAAFEETDAITFDYLPPGTSALTPLYAAVCPDKTSAVIGQEFAGYNFTFEVFWRNQALLLHEAPEARVTASTLGDREAVFIEPLTTEGFGHSAIAWATAHGAITVSALDLPFDEVLRIAEGVKCARC